MQKVLYDIGQTGDELRTRRNTHAQQISGHLDTCCISEPKFKMFPFYKIKTDTVAAGLDTVASGLAKENHFIVKLIIQILTVL